MKATWHQMKPVGFMKPRFMKVSRALDTMIYGSSCGKAQGSAMGQDTCVHN